jgi:hypothetical protein
MRCYKKSEGTRAAIKTERIDCDLMTPDEWLCTYQYSDTENPVQQNESWRMSIPPQQWEAEQQRFKRHHLRAFRPFSLFDGWFWEPDEYLWEPPTSTVIQSVVAEDDIIVLTLTMTEPETAELTLRIDRKQNWLLLEAQSQITLNGEPSEMFVVHEYGESVDGVPLLKKRLATRTGKNYCIAEDVELVCFDPTPVDESIFREENLPLVVPKTESRMENSVSLAEQRMHRHWAIAGCWLVFPLLVIFICKFRKSR